MTTGASLIASGRVPMMVRTFRRRTRGSALAAALGERTRRLGQVYVGSRNYTARRRRHSRRELGISIDVLPVVAEPLHRVLEPFIEVHGWLVAEDFAGTLDRRQQPLFGIPDSRLGTDDTPGIAAQLIDPLRHVENASLRARRDVHFPSDRRVEIGGAQQRVYNIRNVRKVSGLVARAREWKRKSFERPVDEVWDDVAVLPRHLPRPVRVEKPGLHHWQFVVMPEEVGVEFAQHFGDLIRRR